jgi:hypothetical protein
MKRIVLSGMLACSAACFSQEMEESPFGVEARDASWDLRCFPNPTSDMLVIKSSKEVKEVEFYDINGKELKLPALPNNCYSLGDLPSGWVFLLVQSEDGFYERKSVYKN